MEKRNITLQIITDALPEAVHGFSLPDQTAAEGAESYIIMLNSADTAARREQALLHEFRHIYRRDHDRPEPADKIERESRTGQTAGRQKRTHSGGIFQPEA